MSQGILRKLNKDAKGFTLVELMIVVAIIGILAAIAIPQFAAYRIKGFNSAALSDLRNAATGEAGFFADWQSFATTRPNVAAGPPIVFGAGAGGAGLLITGPPTPNNINVADAAIPFAAPVNRGFAIGLSNMVSMEIESEAIVAANPRSASFIAVAKHLNGDTYYAQDSDSESIYQDYLGGSNGTALVVGIGGGGSAQGSDELRAANGPSGNVWSVK